MPDGPIGTGVKKSKFQQLFEGFKIEYFFLMFEPLIKHITNFFLMSSKCVLNF
jgi:hypothetical protein